MRGRHLTGPVRIIALLLLASLGTTARAAEPFEFSSPSAVTRAGTLQGRPVETRDGEHLGRIHDFAIDLESGRVAYVVVSVGSFLIRDSLIAVAPDALRESADADGTLVLETTAQSLRDAGRFAATDWPLRADVVAQPAARSSATPAAASAAATPAPNPRGSATISSGTRTATLTAGERSIRVEERPQPRPRVVALPPQVDRANRVPERRPADTPFGRLDRDGDGLLNRAEIAHELGRQDKYSDIDTDGSGAVDTLEFDALWERRQAQNGTATDSADGA